MFNEMMVAGVGGGGSGYQGKYFELDITGANAKNDSNPIVTGLSEISKMCVWWEYQTVTDVPKHGAIVYDKTVSPTYYLTMGYQNAATIQGLRTTIGDSTNNYVPKIQSLTDGNIVLRNGVTAGTMHYKIFVE